MTATHRIAAVVRGLLATRHLPWIAALLGVVLCLPSLKLGLLLDDDFHRLALSRPAFPTLSRSPADLFVFIEGDPATNRGARSMGYLPWWSADDLRLAFFRPLTGLTHWLDYRLWPGWPSLMHAHSLLWFGLMIGAAAVFYRRMMGPTWVAGLAALLFALDDAHGMPAAWVANRNALLGAFFGLLTLISYDHWRRRGSWATAILTPALFMLALLSKESALAVAGYLFAYALFLDRATWKRRLASLVPCIVVGALWWIAYRWLGYGATGSSWYVDPGNTPIAFAKALATRAPNLLAWQWLIPSDLHWSVSPKMAQTLWLLTMAVLVVIAIGLIPLLRRDRVARFWAVGMLVCLLPACSAFPADRLLTFAGIGGMGLLAQLLAAIARKFRDPGRTSLRYAPMLLVGVFLVFIHLILAPMYLAQTASSLRRVERSFARARASLPQGIGLRTVLIANSPTYSSFAYGILGRLVQGNPYLNPTFVLGSGSRPIQIERPDEKTLLVRPDGGFLAPLDGATRHAEVAMLLFDQRRALETLDRLYRDDVPWIVGEKVQLLFGNVEITSITDDGRPAEAAFHFGVALDAPMFYWMQWRDGAFVAFDPPAVGETVTLPAATMRP